MRARSVRRITSWSTAKQAYFDQVIKYLIMGNVKRGQMYPLCVGAERVMQAQTIAEYARKLGTKVVAHGCTAAGNDQVRFEVALRTLAPELTILAPVRDRAFKRPEQLKYLEERKLPIPPYGAAYSVNRGLWGVTIGGKETLTSAGSIPDHAWVLSKTAFSEPETPTHAHDRLRAWRAGEPRRRAARSRAADRAGRGDRREATASAAASISATRSSAPRAAWRSKRRPPKF